MPSCLRTSYLDDDFRACNPSSVAKLASHDFEHAVFGHGRAVSGRAVEKFRTYAATLQ